MLEAELFWRRAAGSALGRPRRQGRAGRNAVSHDFATCQDAIAKPDAVKGHQGACPPPQSKRESPRPDIRMQWIFGYLTAASKRDLDPMSGTAEGRIPQFA